MLVGNRVAVVNQFQRFIVEYASSHRLTVAELARRMGVDQSTLSRLLEEGTKREPTLTLLFKLAEATGTDICEIVALLAPPSTVHGFSSETAALAVRIQQLAEDKRVALKMLLGWSLG